jgi:hypothetical protein
MAYLYTRGNFRELIHGQFGDNSKLKKNAIRLCLTGLLGVLFIPSSGGDFRSRDAQDKDAPRKTVV